LFPQTQKKAKKGKKASELDNHTAYWVPNYTKVYHYKASQTNSTSEENLRSTAAIRQGSHKCTTETKALLNFLACCLDSKFPGKPDQSFGFPTNLKHNMNIKCCNRTFKLHTAFKVGKAQ
jgi:hypothetical protein